MKLAIGGAQFGLSYGIANSQGKVTTEQVQEILRIALSHNVSLIDTAISYGASESVLGSNGVKNFDIVTKLPLIPPCIDDLDSWLDYELTHSLKRLQVGSIYGLLVHKSEALAGDKGSNLMKSLKRLKDRGVVEKIGVSIYDPTELDAISEVKDLDLVQAPLNIVDRRIISSGWLSKLDKMNIEVHTRSSFLQGLLLLPRDHIPQKFEKWSRIWDFWHNELVKNDLDPLSQCLRSVLEVPQVSRVIVGVDSSSQFQSIIHAAKVDTLCRDWTPMICDDDRLINPFNWDNF